MVWTPADEHDVSVAQQVSARHACVISFTSRRFASSVPCRLHVSLQKTFTCHCTASHLHLHISCSHCALRMRARAGWPRDMDSGQVREDDTRVLQPQARRLVSIGTRKLLNFQLSLLDFPSGPQGYDTKQQKQNRKRKRKRNQKAKRNPRRMPMPQTKQNDFAQHRTNAHGREASSRSNIGHTRIENPRTAGSCSQCNTNSPARTEAEAASWLG